MQDDKGKVTMKQYLSFLVLGQSRSLVQFNRVSETNDCYPIVPKMSNKLSLLSVLYDNGTDKQSSGLGVDEGEFVFEREI